MLLVGGDVQLQRTTASDCGAGIAREEKEVEEEGQWSEVDTVRCAVAARGAAAGRTAHLTRRCWGQVLDSRAVGDIQRQQERKHKAAAACAG